MSIKKSSVAIRFGAKLRYLRRCCDLTQTELTQCLNFSAQTHISNLETGKKAPSLETVIKIGRFFHVSVDYLLRDEIPLAVLISKDLLNEYQNQYRHWCGEKLRTLRIQRGWSQAELSRRLSLGNQGYLSNLELGRQEPSITLLLRLADVLAVTIEEFLPEENQKISAE